MDRSFEYITTLEYRLKAAHAKIRSFESDEKYVQMQTEYQKELRAMECKNRKLEEELAKAHSEIIKVRNQWFEVFEDLQKESEKKAAATQKEKIQLEKRALRAERQRDTALDKITKQCHEIYDLAAKLEEEKGKNLKLRAQINRDYENSSLPSSKSIRCKKISNSREKTGRKPGGQPGHKGHCRKKQIPTREPVLLPPPQKVLEDPDFKKTSRTIKKQLINVRLILGSVKFLSVE